MEELTNVQFILDSSDMISVMNFEYILRLPGTIKEVSNFQKIDNRTVRLEVSGDKINEIEDEVMNDEDFLRKKICEGKDTTDYIGNDLEMNEKFFGEKAPIRVVLAPDSKNQFDYNAEVSLARKNYKKMISQLSIEAVIAEIDTEVLVPKVSNAFKHEKFFDSEDEELFDFEDDLCSLPMSVKLPRKAISVYGGVKKAITSSGENVLDGFNSSTGLYSLGLKEDCQTCEYEVVFLEPDEHEKSLKEVSGDLSYYTAAKCRKIDLGMMDFKAGSKSKEPGFSIGEIKDYDWDKNRKTLVLKVNLPKGAVKSFEIYNEQGEALEVFWGNEMTSDEPLPLSNFYISTRSKLPSRGRIVLEVWDDVKKYKIGFKATDVPLVYDKPNELLSEE